MSRIQDSRVLTMRRLILAAVLGAIMAPALAEDEVEQLINPNTSEFSFGLAHVTDDNQRFGMYNGLDEGKGYGIGSINLVRRYDESGIWVRLNARNIGLSTVEGTAEYERQGDWRIALDYNQIPRVSPYEIHTNLQGIGTNNLTYPNNTNAVQAESTVHGIELETNRYRTKVELSRFFGREFEFKVAFQHETKQGEKIFGRGTAVGANTPQEFLAEPVDYDTRQVDATLNYTGERLQLSGGYYGSFFHNKDDALNITGGAAQFRAAPVINSIAMPPDNSAHQFSLTGGYQFTDTTRGTFRLAHTRAIQDDDFIDVAPLAQLTTRDDLGGRIDTTLVDLGLTSRPTPKLSLVGKLRYEDREDKTTVAQYITDGNSTDGFNEPRSLKTESGKVEATYLLPQGFSLTGGVDAERKERNLEGVRVVGYREDVEEVSYRLNLRRGLSETLNGMLGFVHSDRTGSDFRTLRTWDAALDQFRTGFAGLLTLGGLVQPIHLADRDRNKVTLAVDWAPTDALSLQFNAENARDDYEAGRQGSDVGTRDGKAWLLNVDASYVVNDDWRLSAWATRNVTSLDQATCRSTAGASVAAGVASCLANTWNASLTSRSDAVGLGLRGKVLSKLNIGGDLTYMRDRNEYELNGIGNSVAAADLPTITSYLTTLKLFANYAVGKESSVQLDYILDHRKTNDWTWTDWRFSDGTVIDQDPEETVSFIGISYRYGFR